MKSTHDTIEEELRKLSDDYSLEDTDELRDIKAALTRIAQQTIAACRSVVPSKERADAEPEDNGYHSCRNDVLDALTELEQSLTKK